MIIFRSDVVVAMLEDLIEGPSHLSSIDDRDWWNRELQTVTGGGIADWSEFKFRVEGAASSLTAQDKHALHIIAANILGYPRMSRTRTKTVAGSNWKAEVEQFLIEEDET